MRKCNKLCLAIILLILPSLVSGESASSATLTWVNTSDSSIAASLSASRCMDSAGSQNLVARVFSYPTGNADNDAIVTATVSEPDGDINSITFDHLGQGNNGSYTFDYTFDRNGTYKFAVHASDSNINASHDFNEYIYVKDFGIMISFLNNNASYSPGGTITLRNRVLNSDGNAFNDINGSVSVFYPDSSALHSGQAMADVGNGEYVFSFIAPSTAGTYSATSSFSCGNESDSNSFGRFAIASAAVQQQATVATTTSGGSSGGGGGGGSGGSGSGEAAAIRGFKLEPLKLGLQAVASAQVSQNSLVKKNLLLQMKVVRGDEVEFYTEQETGYLLPVRTYEVELVEKWTPNYAGAYVVTINLLSADKKTKYDTKTIRQEIAGDLRYDLLIECPQPIATAGKPYNFKISAKNFGDYYDDVEVSSWIESEEGQKIGLSSAPIAVKPDSSLDKDLSVFIPDSTPYGTYSAKAKLVFGNEERKASCTFSLKSPQAYYLELLSQLEAQLERLEGRVKEKVSEGATSEYMLEKVNELRKNISEMNLRALNFNFANIDSGIAKAMNEAAGIEDAVAKIDKEAALDFSSITAIVLIVAGIIVIVFITNLIYGQVMKRGRKKVNPARMLEKLLGLEE